MLAPLFLPEKLSNVALGALVPGGIGIALVALAGEDGHAFGWVALACGIGSALTFAVLRRSSPSGCSTRASSR